MMYQSKSKAGGRLRALALVPAVAVAIAVVNIPAVASVISDASEARVAHSDNKVSNNETNFKKVSGKTVSIVGDAGSGESAAGSLDDLEIYVNGKRVERHEVEVLLHETIASIDINKNKSVMDITLKGADSGDVNAAGSGTKNGKPLKVVAVNSVKSRPDDGVAEKAESTAPLKAVEEMPRFPGGEAEMIKFLAYNIKYPEAAKKGGKSGRVVVKFIVSKTGKVESPEIVRSVSPELDAEALRVVGELPDFIPGRSDGKAVACSYVLPVSFSLVGDDEKAKQEEDATK